MATQEEFNQLLSRYQDTGDTRLDDAIDGLINLKKNGEISEELAIKIMKLLINRHIALELFEDMRHSDLDLKTDKQRAISLMRMSYGRKEEHFAF
jgi:hypothetical protein